MYVLYLVPLVGSVIDPSLSNQVELSDILEETRIRCQRDGYTCNEFYVTLHRYIITLPQLELRNELQQQYESDNNILPIKKNPLPNTSRAGKHITAFKKLTKLNQRTDGGEGSMNGGGNHAGSSTGGSKVKSDNNNNDTITNNHKSIAYITVHDHRTVQQIESLESFNSTDTISPTDQHYLQQIRPRDVHIFRLWCIDCFIGASTTSNSNPSELNRDYWYINMLGYFTTSNAYKYCPDWTACSVTEQVLLDNSSNDTLDSLNKLVQASIQSNHNDQPHNNNDYPAVTPSKRTYNRKQSLIDSTNKSTTKPQLLSNKRNKPQNSKYTLNGRIAKKRGRKPKHETEQSSIDKIQTKYNPYSSDAFVSHNALKPRRSKSSINNTIQNSVSNCKYSIQQLYYNWLQLSIGVIDCDRAERTIDDTSDTEMDIENTIRFITNSNGECKPKYFAPVNKLYDEDVNQFDNDNENTAIEQFKSESSSAIS